MKYAFLLCFLPFLARAQEVSETKLSKFSVEVRLGRISSFMYSDEYTECDFPGCEDIILQRLYDPIKTTYASGLIAMRFAKKQQLGVGIAFSQYGFGHSWSLEDGRSELFPHVWNYTGIKVRQRVDMLQSEKVGFGLANSLEYDLRHGQNWFYDLKRTGVSHIVETVLSYSLSTHFEFDLNFVYRTALTKYGEKAYEGRFHRFGAGIVMGLAYQI